MTDLTLTFQKVETGPHAGRYNVIVTGTMPDDLQAAYEDFTEEMTSNAAILDIIEDALLDERGEKYDWRQYK